MDDFLQEEQVAALNPVLKSRLSAHLQEAVDAGIIRPLTLSSSSQPSGPAGPSGPASRLAGNHPSITDENVFIRTYYMFR